MPSTYALLLAAESSVVALAGLVIASLGATNVDVILYPQAITLRGVGLVAAGLGTVALAFGGRMAATLLMVVAATTYFISGWKIATDDIDPEENLPTEYLSREESGGFEEEP